MEETESICLNVSDINCHVCGESKFNQVEGFYYCAECGTKQEQVRAIEMDQDDVFNVEGRHAVKQKLKKQNDKEKVELTSWEFYNYILRGLVDDLLNLGAKQELKSMTLRIWATYLKRLEAAFFSNEEVTLPKLGSHYFVRDAHMLYNLNVEKPKRIRKRNIIKVSKCTEEQTTLREFKRSKRKLDQSAYKEHNSVINEDTVLNDTISQPIQINFSTEALKSFKKVSEQTLTTNNTVKKTKCDRIRLQKREANAFEKAVGTISMKQIYSILAIALNLIGDDIQLTDLLRFMSEEHISIRTVLNYFPENVQENGREMLKDFALYYFTDKYTDKFLRSHISNFAYHISINSFKMPNLYELVKRYIMDFNLPNDLVEFIERLMQCMPSKLNGGPGHHYYNYEARAMAYIIFALKCLFVLDDKTEYQISKSARTINEKLRYLKTLNTTDSVADHPLLFVWDEWMKYIQTRKVIISRHNASYARRFKMPATTSLIVDELITKERKQKEQMYNHREMLTASHKQKQSNIQNIFKALLLSLSETDVQPKNITFQPSLTPSHSYFKRLLYEDITSGNIKIPEYMLTDHTGCSLKPFVNDIQALQNYFANKSTLKLEVNEITIKSDLNYVGIYRGKKRVCSLRQAFVPDTSITKEQWLQELKTNVRHKDMGLTFKKKLESYTNYYLSKLLREDNKFVSTPILSKSENKNYGEKNMDDLKFKLPVASKPAVATGEATSERSCGSNCENLFSIASSEGENEQQQITPGQSKNSNKCTLLISNFDYWMLFGYMQQLTEFEKTQLFNKFPDTFAWLLQICSDTLGIDWCVLYEQLLAIEMMFTYGLENLNEYKKGDLQYSGLYPIKDINILTKYFRDIW